MLVESNFVGVTSDHGATIGVKLVEEDITLDTAALFTDSTADLLPAGAIILAVVVRVLTAITSVNADGFDVGDPTTQARFAAGVGLTVATAKVCQDQMSGLVSAAANGPTQAAAAQVRLTVDGTDVENPTTGKVRVSVLYIACTPLVN